MILPWVSLAPPATREANLRQAVHLINSPGMPQLVRDLLEKLGLRTPKTVEELWASISSERHEGAFTQLRSRHRLHFWHLLALHSHWFAKVTFSLTALVCGLAWGVWATARPSSELAMTEWDPVYPVSQAADASWPRLSRVAALAAGAMLVLVLFVWQLPCLASLGHRGDWSMLLLDAVNGARVAFAPRVLVPLGLSCIILSGTNDLINR
jgi:hypothetical protein